MSEPENELTAIASEAMEVFRIEMETIDRISRKISARTSRMIRVVLAFLVVVSVSLVFQVYSMSRDLSAMISSLDEMYVEFGSMSADMRQITSSVQNIGENVRGITSIGENMQSLNADVGDMQGSLEGVSGDMQTVDVDVGSIANGTSEISYRFANVEKTVRVMQRDIYNMLRPMNMMPR